MADNKETSASQKPLSEHEKAFLERTNPKNIDETVKAYRTMRTNERIAEHKFPHAPRPMPG